MKQSLTPLTCLVLAGCGTYEPPQPGKHRAPGDPVAEITCEYEIPTASRFMALRCQNTEDRQRMAEQAREGADSIRTVLPDVK